MRRQLISIVYRSLLDLFDGSLLGRSLFDSFGDFLRSSFGCYFLGSLGTRIFWPFLTVIRRSFCLSHSNHLLFVCHDDLTFTVTPSFAHIWHLETLPFCIGHDLFDDPLTVDDRWLNLGRLRLQQIAWNLSDILWLQEERRGESLDADVEHAMSSRLEREVGDARHNVADIDDELVVLWLD